MYPFPSESHEEPNRLPSLAAASLPSYFMASFFPMEMAGGADAEHMAMDRALVASRNHREAEKRRRERIKSHLDRLRAILSCDPKTDKASLLAKAVEHVRDLKQRMAEISDQAHLFPTETDEIIVLPGNLHSAAGGDEGSKGTIFEASVCCDDRSDLLPEIIETLRMLRMKTLKAEMATLGGRVRNVLVLAKEKDEECDKSIGDGSDEDGGGGVIREALMNVVNRPVAGFDRMKRRRVVDRADIYV